MFLKKEYVECHGKVKKQMDGKLCKGINNGGVEAEPDCTGDRTKGETSNTDCSSKKQAIRGRSEMPTVRGSTPPSETNLGRCDGRGWHRRHRRQRTSMI